MDRCIQFFLGDVWLRPIEDPPFIRACCNAIPASDTPIVIDYDETVRFLPGGMDRTDLHTRGVLAVLALNGQVDVPFLWNQGRIIVMFGVFEIDQGSSLEPENPDPLKLRVMPGVIVFFYTSVDAPPATNTARKFKAIAPEGIGESVLCADLKFLPILSRISLFELCDDTSLFIFRHLTKMFLQKVFGFLLRTRGEKRERKACHGGE
jgi:hypothetical protein